MTDIEAMAAEAVSAPVNPRQPGNMRKMMERVGTLPIRPRQLVKCPFCREGFDHSSRWSWLWGSVCWACGGWAALDVEKDVRFHPIQPHPFRVS